MNQRFETLAIDLFGPLPLSKEGFQWIFIAEDVATKWVEIFPMERATAEACAKLLIDEVILRYGIPRRCISDNGPQFVSSVMQCVTYCLDFDQCLTPVYHPEANPVERKNRDMKIQLSIALGDNHSDWPSKLPSIRFAMNTTTTQSTGHTPAYLNFGRNLRTPDDVRNDLRAIALSENFVPEITPYLVKIADTMKEVKENIENEQDRNKKYADMKRRPIPEYQVGDLVLVRTHVLSKASHGTSSKFVPKRDGPYKILSKKSSTTYEISRTGDDTPVAKYHVSDLTPYVSQDEKQEEDVPPPTYPIRRRGRPPKKKATHQS